MRNIEKSEYIFLTFLLSILIFLIFPINVENVYFWAIFYTIFGIAAIYYTFVRNNIFDSIFIKYRDVISEKASCVFSRKNKNIKGKIYNLTKGLLNVTEAVVVVLFVQIFFIGHVKVPTASMFPIIKPGDHYLTNMISHKFIGFKRGNIYYFKNSHGENKFLCKRLIALPGEEIFIKNNKVHIDGKAMEWNIEHYTNLKVGSRIKNTLLSDKIWLVPKKGDKLTLKDVVFKVKKANGWVYKDLDEAKKQYLLDGDKFIDNILETETIEILINDKHATGIIFDKDVLKDLLMYKETILKEDYFFFLGDNSYQSLDSRISGFVRKSKIRGSLFLRIWPPSRWELNLL